MSQSHTLPSRRVNVISIATVWTIVMIGTGGCSQSGPDEREKLIVETYAAHKQLLKADRIEVLSGAVQRTILPSDPEYKAVERLWQIRQQAAYYPEIGLNAELAPDNVLSLFKVAPDGTKTLVGSFAHYSEVNKVHTKEYGVRDIPERVEKELVSLWHVLRSAKGHPEIATPGGEKEEESSAGPSDTMKNE